MLKRPAHRALLVALLAVGPASAGEPVVSPPPAGCDTFSWDVARELAALAAVPVAITAGGGGPDGVVRIETETLYGARLLPQRDVALAARPGKPMLDDDAHAGLLTFRVPADGRYRVSITTGHWIDVVDAGRIVPSLDFQGRRGCPLVHKIVEFELPAGRDLVLQFAGGAAEEAGVVITAVANAPK
ncbi:hypothetical protein LDO26_04500 [Luteimonas sp. BDR2-5]|uniref:hypothetical protein n=1 Tax=Proluteimonas luteida TaxID=2878685 RepID=UPI001E3A56C3|nr:hypothetical protein [Luteimonas sp. BDR2-5]MCD9027474.1 hypothetical protein [Luteimonas sp. BDR2-5]